MVALRSEIHMETIRPQVQGTELAPETRCAHDHSPLDIIAIKMECCGVNYACKDCHKLLAVHAVFMWPTAEWDARGFLRGVCGYELTI